MPFAEGFNFRSTLAFVTDPTDTQFVGASTVYPTVSGGVTFGWVSTTGVTARDRSAAIDARLAGIHFLSGATNASFRVDLPSAGTYTIALALGDVGSGYTCGVDLDIKDGTTVLATLGPTGGLNTICCNSNWTDATDTPRTSAADWVANQQTVDLTFSGTSAIFAITGQTGKNSPISHLKITAAAGASTIAGSLSVTFASMTVAGAGTLGPITAQAAVAFSGMTLSAAGVLPIAGEAAVTFAPMTVAGEGVLGAISGGAAITFADMSLQAAGGDPNAEAAAFDVLLRARRRGVR